MRNRILASVALTILAVIVYIAAIKPGPEPEVAGDQGTKSEESKAHGVGVEGSQPPIRLAVSAAGTHRSAEQVERVLRPVRAWLDAEGVQFLELVEDPELAERALAKKESFIELASKTFAKLEDQTGPDAAHVQASLVRELDDFDALQARSGLAIDHSNPVRLYGEMKRGISGLEITYLSTITASDGRDLAVFIFLDDEMVRRSSDVRVQASSGVTNR